MFATVSTDYSPLSALVNTYLRDRGQLNFQGMTQKATEIRAAAQRAYKTGIAEGMTAIITEMRCKRYPKFRVIEAPMAWDMEKFLNDLELAYDEFRSETGKDKEALAAKINEWANQQLPKLIFPADMEEAEERRHRTAVLAGEEEPYESDRDWLNAKLEEAREAAAKVERLVAGQLNDK